MNLTDKEVLQLLNKYGSGRKAAKALNISKTAFNNAVKRIRSGKVSETKAIKPQILKTPKKKGEVKRYILSSAQDGTLVHPFFHTLKMYAEHLDARLLISGYTYNKSLFEENNKKKVSFAPEIIPYLTNDRFEIGDNVVFAGEMNILPTASDPLTGLKTYTGNKWAIIPHARIRLESVPMMKNDPPKIVMTTGTVTKRNYVQKKSGIVSEFHHTYGAVLVEISSDGDFFCRHLIGEEKDGSFYDLKTRVTPNGITHGHRIEGIVYGDVHEAKLDQRVALSTLGYDTVNRKTINSNNLLDDLKPHYQVFHDTIDFMPRNHHNFSDPYHRFECFNGGVESVEQEIKNAARFLDETRRDWCTSVVVESNHDAALQRWLKTADYRLDPVNAIFFLELQLEKYKAMRDGIKDHNIFWNAVSRFIEKDGYIFVAEDEGFKICDGEIECGVHGHLGANGARPSPRSFSKMGTKAVTAHTHSASIFDGVWTAGVMGKLDMGYNKGLSSWSPTHVIIYKNGKRAMLTMSKNGKFYL